jgi:hypothetical protein
MKAPGFENKIFLRCPGQIAFDERELRDIAQRSVFTAEIFLRLFCSLVSIKFPVELLLLVGLQAHVKRLRKAR